MRDYGVWHSIDEMPEEKGLYLLATKDGTYEMAYHNPMLYYPFGISPYDTLLKQPSCWAYLPPLDPRFTDEDVINAINEGKIEYLITSDNVKNQGQTEQNA